MSDPRVTEFLKQMETQVIMGHYDPEQLPIIATNAMQMAAQYSETHASDKKKTEQAYFMVLLTMHRLELEAAQLRLDIATLNAELDDIRQQQDQIADWLNAIDDLIGEGGTYDRDNAMDLLEQITGKRPDDSMSDADIQALLKFEQSQLHTEYQGLENRAGDIEGKIADKESRLGEIEQQITDLETKINDPDTPIEILENTSAKLPEPVKDEPQISTDMELNALSL